MKRGRFAGIGASSVLMIFVVLFLTTFGLLSLVSAQADLRLTRRTAAAAEAYYRADAKAEEILCAVDAALFAAREDTAGYLLSGRLDASLTPPEGGTDAQTVYAALAGQRLSVLSALSHADGDTLSFSVTVSERQELQVEARVLPYDSALRYRVVSRRLTTAAGDWDDQPIEVWSGE